MSSVLLMSIDLLHSLEDTIPHFSVEMNKWVTERSLIKA